MWNSLIFRYISGAFMAASLAGCTVLLGLSDTQCNSDTECVDAQLGTSCVDHICIGASNCQGTACYGRDGGVGACASDKDCSATPSTPRCLLSNCVSSTDYAQWACEELPEATTETVQYSFRVVDLLSKTPPKNVVGKACRTYDPKCLQPVATFTDMGQTGDVKFTLPRGFLGFFEITSEELPALLYVTKPISQNLVDRDVPVVSTSTLEALAAVMGVTYDPTKGVALLEALDCSGAPAGGVQFKANRESGTQFYLVDGIPDKAASVTKYDMTDNTADGGFINLAEGGILLSAYLGADGPKLGSFNATIRPNTITYIEMKF